MFTFKGIHADNYDVKVLRLPPIKKANQKIRFYEVDGRDGSEVQELGFQGYMFPCEIILKDLTQVDDVVAWLSGSGVLIRDDDNTKYQYASIYNEVDYHRLVSMRRATFEFYIAKPFRYLLDETDTTINAPTNITNLGTYYSEPLLHITGSGVINVIVGDYSFTYDFDEDSEVYIDSEIKEAYLGTTLKNRQMTGDFPILNVGSNSVSWTGTVTEIVITQRTRYL